MSAGVFKGIHGQPRRRQTQSGTVLLPGFLLVVIVILLGSPTQATETAGKEPTASVLDMSIEELLSVNVYAASRRFEDIDRSSASVWVLKRQNFEHLGIQDLRDALELAPSTYSVPSGAFGFENFSVRGSVTDTINEGILLLWDGFEVNESFANTMVGLYMNHLSLGAIDRIEFVRTPNSSLYGGSAYYGIVNLIPRQPQDIDGVEINADYSWENDLENIGSRIEVVYGEAFNNGWQILSDFQYQKKEGFDTRAGTNPYGQSGQANNDLDISDFILSAAKGNWHSVILYHYADGEDNFGTAGVIDPKGNIRGHQLTWGNAFNAELTERLELEFLAYLKYFRADNEYVILPASFTNSLPPLPAEEIASWSSIGVYEHIFMDMWTYDINPQIHWRPHDAHDLIAGIDFKQSLSDSSYRDANYNPDLEIAEGVPAPLPSVQRVSNWLDDPFRNTYWGVYIQDQWSCSSSLQLTGGIRYDKQIDYGGHLSPRLGLSCFLSPSLTLKAQYSHAYYQHSVNATRLKDSSDPDLREQSMDTFDAGIGWQVTGDLHLRGTMFASVSDNLVVDAEPYEAYAHKNTTEATVLGLELEGVANITREWLARGSLTAMDMDSDSAEYTPGIKHLAKLMNDFRLFRNGMLSVTARYNGEYHRKKSDSRPPIPDYVLVDSTFSYRFSDWMSLALTVHNLLDKSFRTPDDSVFFSEDFTGPGRSFTLSMHCRF